MSQVVIENPIINSPYEEPKRHFRFTDEGITNEIIERRRISSYFIPIAKPKKKGKQLQLSFDTEWTQDRIEENKFINQIRDRVALWRTGGRGGLTKITTRLLEYWQRPDRERRLFFCQIEAVETIIYLTEVAKKYGDAWIENALRTANEDANTVAHILGVRAFGTQLLCEQVVGRGLRRRSYVSEPQRYQLNGQEVVFEGFAPEYAEVYGVPFSFIPCSGSNPTPEPGPEVTHVRALEERIACEITFPRLMGYRYNLPVERLTATFTEDSRLILSTRDIPTKTENAPIVGESSIHTLDDLKQKRVQEVAFLLAKLTLEKYFRDDDENLKPWLFPQLLQVAKTWLAECVIYKDNTFPQLLLFLEFAHDAVDRIYKAIIASETGARSLKPILYPYDPIGSTRYVAFDTRRPVYATNPGKCHVSHVVADTDSWEQKLAQALEDMEEVICYVKNHNLGFTIPYTFNGEEKNYIPDFIVRLDDGQGKENTLNLILEVTGESRKDKAAKVATARTLWVPAVNNHGNFGRWAFLEISDPWDAQNTIRTFLK